MRDHPLVSVQVLRRAPVRSRPKNGQAWGYAGLRRRRVGDMGVLGPTRPLRAVVMPGRGQAWGRCG